jgi:AcrR family transcriptional regulator
MISTKDFSPISTATKLSPSHKKLRADSPVTVHERKRVDVLEAAWRCILRVGLENVTIREIAAELQATTGTVVHYFRTKDEILLYALDHLITAITQEVQSSVEGVQGLARLEQILFASLPLDEEGDVGWRIWLAFLKTSVGSTRLSTEHARRTAYLRSSLVDEIHALQKQKVVRAGIDVPLEADALIALVDGIGMGRVIDAERFPPARQKMLVKRHISAYLAPLKA